MRKMQRWLRAKGEAPVNLGKGKVLALFPSGDTIICSGELLVGFLVPEIQGLNVVVYSPDVSREIPLVDPRAVITVDGSLRYSPRNYLAYQDDWVSEWLAEHPEWPPENMNSVLEWLAKIMIPPGPCPHCGVDNFLHQANENDLTNQRISCNGCGQVLARTRPANSI